MLSDVRGRAKRDLYNGQSIAEIDRAIEPRAIKRQETIVGYRTRGDGKTRRVT